MIFFLGQNIYNILSLFRQSRGLRYLGVSGRVLKRLPNFKLLPNFRFSPFPRQGDFRIMIPIMVPFFLKFWMTQHFRCKLMKKSILTYFHHKDTVRIWPYIYFGSNLDIDLLSRCILSLRPLSVLKNTLKATFS